MMRTSLFLFWLMMAFGQITAQSTVFESDQSRLNLKQKGPNTNYFQEGYLAYGLIPSLGETDSAQTVFGSFMFAYGTRGTVKFNRLLSGVWGLEYNRKSYRIKQDSLMNLFSLGQEHKQERFTWNNFRLSAGMRFQLGKTGNARGNFLMLMADLEYGAWVNKFIERKDPASQLMGSGSQEYRFKQLNYVSRFQSNLSCRIGMNKFALFARYRMSDLWKASEDVNNGRAFDEFSRLIIGLDLSF